MATRGFIRPGLAGLALAGVLAGTPVSAQEIKTYSKAGSFEDVKFDLNNAIVGRGLVIDQNGHIGRMLERTGADLGATKPIYKNAEFFSFCSAKLSRQMMEAEPSNIGFCPYIVFIYETASKPGEIVIGYRRPAITGNQDSQAALVQIEKLLDGIAQEAVK
jgi:uncharacterized protein (DUF302 family)